MTAPDSIRFGQAADRVPDAQPVFDIAFTAIAPRPALPWFEPGESQSRAAYPMVAVLSAQPAWHRAWTLRHEGQAGVLPVPEVDFAVSAVVVVEIGARPSTGYTVEVERIVKVDGVLYVCALERQPGPQAVTGPAVTYPSASVATDRFDGPIRVVLESRIQSAGLAEDIQARPTR
jgi:hypothetical protein